MFRIQGHIIPDNKAVSVGLTYVYGVGLSTAKKICDKYNLPYEKKVSELSEDERKLLIDHLKEMVLENDLRREVASNIKRLKEIKCYRGMRHNLGLPVRGQNTRKRGRTAKKLLGRSRVRPVLKK